MSKLSITEFATLLGEVKDSWSNEILTIKDCIKLSEDILFQTKKNISSSSLFRWFVLNNLSHVPYQNTQNVLKEYIKIKVKKLLINSLRPKLYMPDSQSLELISYSLQHYEIKGFLTYLNKMPKEIFDLHQSNKMASCVGMQLRNSVKLQKTLIPELVKSEQGRIHIIELFCDEDFLEGYFKDTLEKYISVYPNKSSKKILDDFIFATHLLSKSYILSKDFTKLRIIQIEFEKNIPQIKRIYNKLHPLPRLRFHLLVALFENISKNWTPKREEEIILEAKNLMIEFPIWSEVILFTLVQTAAQFNWKDSMSFVIEQLNKPSTLTKKINTPFYQNYIVEIVSNFGGISYEFKSSDSNTDIYIEYKRYNQQIQRLRENLNSLLSESNKLEIS